MGLIKKNPRQDRVAQVRILEEIDLLEVSLVTFPSNPCAQIINFKEHVFKEPTLLQKLQECAGIFQKTAQLVF
jgi:phage head maturation protease